MLLISIDCRWRDQLGSLEPGNLANFCVLTEDPRQVDPGTIAEVAVPDTWVSGARTWPPVDPAARWSCRPGGSATGGTRLQKEVDIGSSADDSLELVSGRVEIEGVPVDRQCSVGIVHGNRSDRIASVERPEAPRPEAPSGHMDGPVCEQQHPALVVADQLLAGDDEAVEEGQRVGVGGQGGPQSLARSQRRAEPLSNGVEIPVPVGSAQTAGVPDSPLVAGHGP